MIQLGDFVIDRENAKVYQGKTIIELEPKTFQLLIFFIDNPGVIITRDDLVDNLWSGRFVSDNTLNKHIANLRKTLGDDPKQARYLETLSKRGYRLVCPVGTKVSSENSVVRSVSKPTYLYFSLTIFVAIICVVIVFNSMKTNELNVKSYEVTRSIGVEFSPRAISNQNAILYLNQLRGQENKTLWYKNIASNKEHQVDIDNSVISRLISNLTDEDNTFVYFVGERNQGCFVYKAKLLRNEELTEFHPVMDCGTNQLYDVEINKTGDVIFYTAAKVNSKTYQIYKYDVVKNSHELINQPTSPVSSNQSIDLSPDGNKMLIMSINNQRQTTFFVLDLVDGGLTEHKTLDYYVTEAIWAHDSERIFYSATPPSHQILISELDGPNENVVVNVTNYLSNDMQRFNSDQLLFATRQINFYNTFVFSNNENLSPENSVVFDTVPALFHHEKLYIFISNRSGESQIYIGDLESGQSTNLSNLSRHHIFKTMQISPDDKYLLVAGHNTVWKLNIDEIRNLSAPLLSMDHYKVFQSEAPIHNINWLNNQYFIISTDEEKRPNHLFRDNESIPSEHLARWQFIFSDHFELGKLYLVERFTGKLFWTETEAFLDTFDSNVHELETLKQKLPYSYFDPQIFSGEFYYVTREDGLFHFYRHSLKDGRLISRISLDGYFEFDVNEIGLMMGQLHSFEGDIHRAVFE